MSDQVTYTEIGLTQAASRGEFWSRNRQVSDNRSPQDGGVGLPPGYRHLRIRRELRGRNFAAVGTALLSWQVHRRAGVRMVTAAASAAPGVRVATTLGIGKVGLAVPCQVIWAENSSSRAGFGYGTLPGHQFSGEEAFVVEKLEDGRLVFTVVAYSRPATRLSRFAGPLVPLFQHGYLRWLARAAGKISRTAWSAS